MTKTLTGKIVVITGASSGFGEAAAHLFAEQGAVLILTARRLEKLQEIARQIQGKGGKAQAIAVDVTDLEAINSMVETVITEHGRIDIVFNNAGFGRLDWLENLDPLHDIATQVDVNLMGVIQVSRAVLPHMIQQRAGHIINMSSVAGFLAAPLYTIYAATKFGVRGFNNALRREAAPFGVKVSGIYPGPAETEFIQHTGNNMIKNGSLQLPGWLSMTAEDVARRVVRLAKHPRRSVIMPWYFHILIWFDTHLPGLSDWVQMRFAKKFHQVD